MQLTYVPCIYRGLLNYDSLLTSMYNHNYVASYNVENHDASFGVLRSLFTREVVAKTCSSRLWSYM